MIGRQDSFRYPEEPISQLINIRDRGADGVLSAGGTGRITPEWRELSAVASAGSFTHSAGSFTHGRRRGCPIVARGRRNPGIPVPFRAWTPVPPVVFRSRSTGRSSGTNAHPLFEAFPLLFGQQQVQLR